MEKKLRVEGMSCQHCVGRVKKYLESVENVTDVHVDLENKSADFKVGPDIDMDAVIEKIKSFGFTATEKS